MFAYCLNHPVCYFDNGGKLAIVVSTIAVVGEILFDACVTALVTVTIWEIGTYSSILIKKLSSFSSEAPIATAYASQKEKISVAVDNSYAKSMPKKYRTEGEWHHLVAQKAPNAVYSRVILEKVSISVNSPENLIYIKTGLHRRLHTDLYYGWANSVVISAYEHAKGNPMRERSAVLIALASIRAFVRGLDMASPY